MNVTAARLQGTDLILSLQNPNDAGRFVYDFKPGDYELNLLIDRRSLTANNYCWYLIRKISDKVNVPEVEVYRDFIKNISCKTVIVCAQEEYVEEEIRTFCFGHIGRMVDIGESKIPGCVVLHKKYGSSSFNKQQMADFIERIIQECINLDIEYKSQEEIERLLMNWDKDRKVGVKNARTSS